MVALPASSVGESELQSLARQVARSKKVAFIVGAGISTASGIPDFRSSTTGLFASLREKNPELKIASGKDLFHSNLFQVSHGKARPRRGSWCRVKWLADFGLARPTASARIRHEPST
jgi:hypothetical protein